MNFKPFVLFLCTLASLAFADSMPRNYTATLQIQFENLSPFNAKLIGASPSNTEMVKFYSSNGSLTSFPSNLPAATAGQPYETSLGAYVYCPDVSTSEQVTFKYGFYDTNGSYVGECDNTISFNCASTSPVTLQPRTTCTGSVSMPTSNADIILSNKESATFSYGYFLKK